jgi:hypothetical protein
VHLHLWVAHWLAAWFVTYWLLGARKDRPQQRASLGKAASTGRIRRGLSDFCGMAYKLRIHNAC